MHQRYTARDVRIAFDRAVSSARKAGLTADHWTLEEGRPGMGINWKLETGRHGDDYVAVGGFASIGRTAREAALLLHTLANAWDAVALRNDIMARKDIPLGYVR